MSSGRTDPPSHPTLINLPPPPSDPAGTPSDLPGTPNSTTTSMSELSTVAIKDGHRGHLPHHHHSSGHPLDAERADRISRLAGLDRVGQSRIPPTGSVATNQTYSAGAGGYHPHQTQAYFDANNVPQITRERSTVGSASATGSVGGRTTWASESDVFGEDKESEDMDVDGESVGGFSDEAASLVGFGEGARTPARQLSGVGSPTPGAKAASSATQPPPAGAAPVVVPLGLRQGGVAPPSPMSGVSTQTTASVEAQRRDARMIDGMTYDAGFVDTAHRTPPPAEDGEATTGGQLPARQLRSSGPVS